MFGTYGGVVLMILRVIAAVHRGCAGQQAKWDQFRAQPRHPCQRGSIGSPEERAVHKKCIRPA